MSWRTTLHRLPDLVPTLSRSCSKVYFVCQILFLADYNLVKTSGSHESPSTAAPGYPRFSGSLAHTFLPISHLDHHANSGVLYGQHHFYDTQKENFYLRSLPSQPPLISANHSIPPMSRTETGNTQVSCSRDAGSAVNLHKSLKEASIDKGMVSGTKDKERPSSKHESKDRHPHNQHPQPQHLHSHQPQHHSQHPSTMDNMNSMERHKASLLMEYKDHSQSMSKPLSACLLNGKMQNGDSRAEVGSKGSMPSCGGESMGRGPGDSTNAQARHMGNSSTGRCTKEAATLGRKLEVPFNWETQNARGWLVGEAVPKKRQWKRQVGVWGILGTGTENNRSINSNSSSLHHKSSIPTEKQKKPLTGCTTMIITYSNSSRTILSSIRLCALIVQIASMAWTPRDCSHSGSTPNSSPLTKTISQQGPGSGGGSCSMQREGQKVARIRHQQHGRTGSGAPSAELGQTSSSQELKRKMDMSPYGYNNSSQHHSHQQSPVPPWAMHPHHIHLEEDQRRVYMESVCGPTSVRQQPHQHQSAGMGPPPAPAQNQQEVLGPQGEGSAMKNLLKYSNQQQPLLLSQKTPFGGLGSIKTGPNNTNCTLQTAKTTLPPRKVITNESERHDCGGRSREMGEVAHGEGEVRQPPVGIAVAVARQKEPTCRPPDNHPSSCQGRIHSGMKGISHTSLHQNLPPGFSTTMPAPLQPVLPLPQDPSAQLVVLPTEPASHPATHHLDTCMQKKPEDHGACGVDLQDILSEPRNSKATKSYTFGSSNRASSPPRASAAHMSPCCQSPCMHPHPKSTPSTPCPVPSPAATVPCSPAISPAPSQLPNITETQDKRAKGQPPQDYPQSMEPDLPPGYSYPAIAMGYRGGPSPQDVQLAEPAELEAIPVEPVEHAPAPLSSMAEGPECHAIVRPITESQLPVDEKNEENLAQEQVRGALEQNGEPDTLVCCVPVEQEQAQGEAAMLICHPEESSACEAAPCPGGWLEEPVHKDSTIVCQDDGDLLEKGNVVSELKPQTATAPEHPCVPVNPADLQPSTGTEVVAEETENEAQEEDCVQILSAPSSPISATPFPQPIVPSYWSLELLIAAAFCGDCPPPSPPASTTSQGCAGPFYASTYGMELLSELADLERQQKHQSTDKSEGQEQLIFDLQSLATLAVARALEFDSKANSIAVAGQQCPAKRTLNLRRKCNWTPRHEPVCPVKGAMDAIDSQELAIRVRLADLQRRYKEKQKELVKLQRKHDHQKEETPRSPARRGPGRPRKRKSTGLGPVAPSEPQKKVKSVGVVLLTEESGRGGGDLMKKRRLSNRSFGRLGAVQVKMQSSQKSLHEHHMAQLKSKPSVSKIIRERETLGSAHLYTSQRSPKADTRLSNMTANESEGQSDTVEIAALRKSWKGLRNSKKKSEAALNRVSACVQQPRARGQDATEDGETFAEDTESSDQEEEEAEGSYNIDAGHIIKVPPSRELPSSSILKDPSPSSVVKLEVNQKAKNKRERQELYAPAGSQLRSNTEGEVKVKKRPHCRPAPDNATKTLGVRRRPGRPRLQEKLWAGHYRKPAGLLSFSSTSERLRRATRKSSMLRGVLSKKSCWSAVVQSPQSDDTCKRRTRFRQSKGRAVSRLLESFAADDGFQLGGDSSFSDEDEENSSSSTRHSPAPPNCVLTKDLLTEGLKILISKEDELLYAARVRTLDLLDIYSIVIDGERGNRPRIYSLEQLLQEAVLDVRPETEALLTEGTRVCAYWSERSRCLYPGYVRRGGSNDECKPGGVMVEFDDGDRGWISLRNIRLLPPGYQIHYAESSPTPVSSGRSDKIVLFQEGRSSQIDRSSEKTTSTEEAKTKEKPMRKPGRPKGSGLKRFTSDSVSKTSSSPLTWPSLAQPRKRAPVNLFQLNGSASKKTTKNREAVFPHASVSVTSSAKCIFSSRSFEVDSFSSIANGYSSFCSQNSGIPVEGRSSPYGQGRKSEETDIPRGRKNEFLIKLDHEGVMNPKNKSSKALLMLGGSGFGSKGISAPPKPEAYSHPVLLVKDKRKGDSSRAELLPIQRKPSPSLLMSKHGDMGLSCHRDCHSSYSDMDEEDEEEEERRRRSESVLVPASGGMRMAGHFLPHLSVSSSSSGSSSSSSSGSISSSSVCSSDNDSSYSSEDDENSTLLLQSCLTPHHTLLHPHKAPTGPPQHSFVAKAMAVSSAKGGNVDSAARKPLKRKECLSSSSKTSKDLVKRQKLLADHSRLKVSSCLPARQLWRWSGNPTQRRGLKGKARKLYYKSIVRGRDTVHVGDCAVFLSAGRPHLPYIGRIESFWETWTNSMVVKVKWFYHPEETNLGKRLHDGKHALYQSCHEDENDVQTISHKCQVVSRKEYEHLSCNRKPGSNLQDLYYLAGTYDPTSGQLLTSDGVSILC
ncbi:hypothetical protein QTP86_032746 [Hemibagrus guttatus]|nr:hypothetical protein QTP86_032746 [Hemibagrus guttatus]